MADWPGYVVAFMLGVICTLQLGIVKNARQLRRNSESIRRRLERSE